MKLVIKVFEAFAGYGSQSLALERLNIPHEVVCISEIDKYALQAYKALHGEVLNLGDISKLNTDDVPDHDLFTYSFPCQDISVAGKQAGILEGTRSGLLWECERVIIAKKPRYLLMENVKNLVGKKHKSDFDRWCKLLESHGYTNYWKVLNAKDYGVPQNRERVFMVSILGEHKPYVFPENFDREIRLRDMLEDEVDEKYYINQDKVKKLLSQLKDINKTILGNVNPSGNGINGNVYNINVNAPTLTTNKGEGLKICVPCLTPDRLEKRQNGRRFKEDGDPMFTLTSQDRHGILGIDSQKVLDVYGCEQRTDEGLRFYKGEYIGALRTIDSCGDKRVLEVIAERNLRIRKLTPRECFRLMGLHENDIDKIQATGISSNQQYKLAGNSIVVDVLEHIFSELFN